MLQYLLNTTAIWLMSLMLFDVFLRRESYHRYNRFYLLFTFLLGSLFPLVQWQGNNRPYPATLEKPIAQVITAKQNVIAATTPTASFNWQQWLFIVYLTGAMIVFVLLLVEVMKLISWYRSGKRSTQDNWTIIETGKEHAPFSLLNILFVCSGQQYNNEEWSMILVHEERHHVLLHFIDLLLMQFSRIVFWFHPLVYVYNKRLLLIHEYQADKATARQPKVYGKFLVEQALLQAAPSIAHSFNRSPIKKRIVMLTRRSSSIAKSKLLVFIPLLLVCLFCFSQNTMSNKPKKVGNFVKYKGNTIEFLAPKKPDSYMERDAVTGKLHRAPIYWPTPPIKLNGQKIYDPEIDKTITKPTTKNGYKNFADYILQNTANECEALPDGDYFFLVLDVVMDTKGKVVYFDNQGVHKIGSDDDKQSKVKQQIDNKIDALMDNAPLFEPSKLNDSPVPITMGSIMPFFYGYNSEPDITIKNHKITWKKTDKK